MLDYKKALQSRFHLVNVYFEGRIRIKLEILWYNI